MDFYCDQVLSGLAQVQVVAETGQVLAFHHTQPYWPVHIVIIPKRHIASLAALEEGEMAILQEMMAVASEICREVTAKEGGMPPFHELRRSPDDQTPPFLCPQRITPS